MCKKVDLVTTASSAADSGRSDVSHVVGASCCHLVVGIARFMFRCNAKGRRTHDGSASASRCPSRSTTGTPQTPVGAQGAAGLLGGAAGLAMDPTRGWHDGGFPLMVLGLGKGVLGLALRPACGALQFLAKGALGAGLVCLGREAISGSTLRRMRAPAALNDDSAEARPRGRPCLVSGRRPMRRAAWSCSHSRTFFCSSLAASPTRRWKRTRGRTRSCARAAAASSPPGRPRCHPCCRACGRAARPAPLQRPQGLRRRSMRVLSTKRSLLADTAASVSAPERRRRAIFLGRNRCRRPRARAQGLPRAAGAPQRCWPPLARPG